MHTGADTDPDPGEAWPGWEIVHTDTTSFAAWDYVVHTYEVGAPWPNAYETALGSPRRFYLLAPTAPAGDLPVVMSFHGGALDDDSDPAYYTEGDPWETKCGVAADVAAAFLTPEHTMMPYLAAERGWAMVFPENLWCDFWTGRGPEDPVDSGHRSYEHVAEILDFMVGSGPGFGASALYAWGSSSGGGGAAIAAARYPGMNGVIVDSAPCDPVLYFPDDPRAIEHVMGGPPFEGDGTTKTAAYPNYLAASCTAFVADGLAVPMYVAWNRHDALTNSSSPTALTEAIDAHMLPAGLRAGHHDFNHMSPGTTFHAQTRQTAAPYPYTTELMFRFLEGRTLIWEEAEEGCPTGCTTGRTEIVEDNSTPWSAYSGGGGREASAPGVMWRAAVPADLPPGVPVRATAILVAEAGTLDPSVRVATLVYEEAGVELAHAELMGDTFALSHVPPADAAAMVREVQQHDLGFTPVDPARGVLRLDSAGLATLRLDAIVYSY